MLSLPPPTTFVEGERKKYGILMSIAGVCYGLAAIAAACVVIWGTWPEGLAKIRLYIVGAALLMACAGSICVTIALAVGGPVGRFKTKVSREGVEAEAEGDAN
jgi:hypothetical protein